MVSKIFNMLKKFLFHSDLDVSTTYILRPRSCGKFDGGLWLVSVKTDMYSYASFALELFGPF